MYTITSWATAGTEVVESTADRTHAVTGLLFRKPIVRPAPYEEA
jgi:hypothetical protein